MKKKSQKVFKKLELTKEVISSLSSNQVKGGQAQELAYTETARTRCISIFICQTDRLVCRYSDNCC